MIGTPIGGPIGGTLTVAKGLKGVAGSGAVGTLSGKVEAFFAGVSGTVAVGDLTAAPSALLSGVNAVGYAGDFAFVVEKGLTGVEGTGAIGEIEGRSHERGGGLPLTEAELAELQRQYEQARNERLRVKLRQEAELARAVLNAWLIREGLSPIAYDDELISLDEARARAKEEEDIEILLMVA